MNILQPESEIKPNFVGDKDKLFKLLLQTIAWDTRMYSRRTAIGVAYNYSGIFYLNTEMHDLLLPLCNAIAQSFGFMPNNCLLNYYPNF
jgi:hypothetical protein